MEDLNFVCILRVVDVPVEMIQELAGGTLKEELLEVGGPAVFARALRQSRAEKQSVEAPGEGIAYFTLEKGLALLAL